jgi:hypothetical protein
MATSPAWLEFRQGMSDWDWVGGAGWILVRRDLTGYTYELEGWSSALSGVLLELSSPPCMAERARYKEEKVKDYRGARVSGYWRSKQAENDRTRRSRPRTDCVVSCRKDISFEQLGCRVSRGLTSPFARQLMSMSRGGCLGLLGEGDVGVGGVVERERARGWLRRTACEMVCLGTIRLRSGVWSEDPVEWGTSIIPTSRALWRGYLSCTLVRLTRQTVLSAAVSFARNRVAAIRMNGHFLSDTSG